MGVKEVNRDGKLAIRIPYYGSDGKEAAVRYRTAITGDDKFRWRTGSKTMLYGLWRLKNQDLVVVCEGESDTQTLWFHGYNAVGIPGASTLKSDRDLPHLEKYETIN